MEDNALDAHVAPDRVEPLAQLLDTQSRPGDEPLPERAGRIGEGGQAFLEHEDHELGRPADRAADARDEPPDVAERKQEHPSSSAAKF